MISESAAQLLSTVQIGYDFNESDHFPLIFDLQVSDCCPTVPPTRSEFTPQGIRWDRTTPDQLLSYLTNSGVVAQSLLQRSLCQERGCAVTAHQSDIDNFYRDLEAGLCQAARVSLSPQRRLGPSQRTLPGWDSIARSSHAAARAAFLRWKAAGCPPSGTLCDLMASTRKTFKASVRRCKHLEKSRMADRLAESLLSKNPSDFWGYVKSLSPPSMSVGSVGGVTGDSDIAEVWLSHFKRLLGTDDSHSPPPDTLPPPPGASFVFSAGMCQDACRLLNSAASPGLSELSVSSFKKASPSVYEVLSRLFNSMLAHSYMPHCISDSVMIPIPKGKLVDPSNMESYRGIALTSTVSKIMEVALEHSLKDLLQTSPHQFAFKEHHSTMDAVFLLNEITREYSANGSPVYACFLDLRKAFDSVDHSKLIDCLTRRGLPPEVVALLQAWLSTQRMCIRWATALSGWFKVKRGVRQGGCLSPTLFNLYLDGVLTALGNSNVGCGLGGCRINVLAYADDLVLLAPSLDGLQFLVNLSETLLGELNLQINTKKTDCLAFLPSSCGSGPRLSPPVRVITLGSTALPWVSCYKYLGVLVSSSGDPGPDLTRARRAFLASANTVTRRFAYCSLAVQSQLYKSFCYYFYGAELWHKPKSQDLRVLGVAIHSASKRLLGRSPYNSTRLASLELDVMPLAQLLVAKRLTFLRRLISSPNPLIGRAVHGTRWSVSPFLRETTALTVDWHITNLNFLECSFTDMHDMFLWEVLRSLVYDPPYVC